MSLGHQKAAETARTPKTPSVSEAQLARLGFLSFVLSIVHKAEKVRNSLAYSHELACIVGEFRVFLVANG